MQGCFGVPRFWASLRHSSSPSESTRPKPHTGSAEGKMQPQRCWQTPRQRGAKTSTRHFDITDWSPWLGRLEFGKALQTSTPCRLRCAAPWPGSVISRGRGAEQRTQRLPSCSRSCGWAGARSQRGTLRPTTAPRSTSWPWRPKRWASWWTRLPFCGLTALHTGISPRARFSWEPSGHSSFLASWTVGHFGIGTCSSSWSHEVCGHRKGWRGSGARTTAAASYATKDQAPCSTACTSARPCRQKETRTSLRSCARRHVLWELNTGNSLHIHSANRFSRTGMTCFVAQSVPDGLLERHIFTGRLLVGQRCSATGWLGCGGRRRCRKPQCGGVWCGTERRFAWAVRQRWRRLRSGHGGAVHIGSAHSAHRLRRYHRDNQRSKTQSLGSPRPPSTRLEQASGFPGRGQGSQGQGSCDRARRAGGAHFPLVQKGKRLCRHFCKERGRHAQARFSSRQDSCCLCVLGQASGTLGGRSARFAQVQGMERHQGRCATITDTAPASETQAKAGEGDCCAGCRSGF